MPHFAFGNWRYRSCQQGNHSGMVKTSRLWPGRHAPERMEPWLMSRLTAFCANVVPTTGSPSSRACRSLRSAPGARVTSGTRPGCARPRPPPTATTRPWPAGGHSRGRHRRPPRANLSSSLCYNPLNRQFRPNSGDVAQRTPDCGPLHPAYNIAERLALPLRRVKPPAKPNPRS